MSALNILLFAVKWPVHNWNIEYKLENALYVSLYIVQNVLFLLNFMALLLTSLPTIFSVYANVLCTCMLIRLVGQLFFMQILHILD